MKTDHGELSHIRLAQAVTFDRPAELPVLVHLDDPAVDVMTDFKQVRAVTVAPDVTIDDALEKMKKSGVRLLLVEDEAHRIVGLITATDIQGERPIKLAEDTRVPRSRILVGSIMTPQDRIDVLNMVSVRNAHVGHIIETLQRLERQHILVVRIDEASKQQTVCGLFSTSQIAKQLGRDLPAEVPPAHSLAEIQHELQS